MQFFDMFPKQERLMHIAWKRMKSQAKLNRKKIMVGMIQAEKNHAHNLIQNAKKNHSFF